MLADLYVAIEVLDPKCVHGVACRHRVMEQGAVVVHAAFDLVYLHWVWGAHCSAND